MSPRFKAAREDGRSDRQVVLDLVGDSEPETRFSYDQIINELSNGLDHRVERNRVYRAVGTANKTLLRERKRYLSVVENEGYRVIRSDEHLPAALDRKGRAETHLKAGMDLLRNARLDELDDNQRALHEGQLLVLGGLVESMRESTRRSDRIEKLVEDLLQRVDNLERAD